MKLLPSLLSCLTPLLYLDALPSCEDPDPDSVTDADAGASSAVGGRADGEARGAAGGGEEAEAVNLPQGRRCLCHSLTVKSKILFEILSR